MQSKGQAWAEYIIVLAVVVIMAGVAVYLAGSFLGGSGRVEEHDSASYWLSADVAISRYYVNSSQSQLVIKNNRNFKINVTGITSRGVGILLEVGGSNSITLEPGQVAQVNVMNLVCSGGTYSLPLSITYSDAVYGTKYSLYGEKPLVGQCMGSASISPAPECTKNSDCGANSTPCNQFCNASQNCTYLSNPATCQNTCSGGSCQSCTPSCGSATCTSCGTTTISCSSPYCNGSQNCTSPPTASCNIPCSGSTCTSCSPTCTATCTNCPNGQICQNGYCTPACQTNCTFYGSVMCNQSCSGSCTNFKLVCDNVVRGSVICSNSTGGASPPLNSYVSCCNGTVTNCANISYCSSGNCITCTTGYANCNNDSADACETALNTTTNCGSCGNQCLGGMTCQNGQCVVLVTCQPDCTFNGVCNQSCSGTNGCSNFRPACDTFSNTSLKCSNSTGGTLNTINYYVSCCNGTPTLCGSNSSCPHQTAWCNGNTQNCTNDTLVSSCNFSCSNGVCGSSCTPTCTTGSCTSCGTNNSITCPHPNAWCNGTTQNCTADTITPCTRTCSGNGTCGSCTPTCTTGTCTTCSADQKCQNGNCVNICNNNGVCETGGGETYSNCPHDCCEADCSAAYDTTCHQECSPYCNNFRPACGGALVGDAVCISSTQYTTCCNGVITTCPNPTTKCCPGGICVRPAQACPS